MTEVRTINEWMDSLAAALRVGDESALDRLATISGAWIQPDDETAAQLGLIDAALDVVLGDS